MGEGREWGWEHAERKGTARKRKHIMNRGGGGEGGGQRDVEHKAGSFGTCCSRARQGGGSRAIAPLILYGRRSALSCSTTATVLVSRRRRRSDRREQHVGPNVRHGQQDVRLLFLLLALLRADHPCGERVAQRPCVRAVGEHHRRVHLTLEREARPRHGVQRRLARRKRLVRTLDGHDHAAARVVPLSHEQPAPLRQAERVDAQRPHTLRHHRHVPPQAFTHAFLGGPPDAVVVQQHRQVRHARAPRRHLNHTLAHHHQRRRVLRREHRLRLHDGRRRRHRQQRATRRQQLRRRPDLRGRRRPQREPRSRSGRGRDGAERRCRRRGCAAARTVVGRAAAETRCGRQHEGLRGWLLRFLLFCVPRQQRGRRRRDGVCGHLASEERVHRRVQVRRHVAAARLRLRLLVAVRRGRQQRRILLARHTQREQRQRAVHPRARRRQRQRQRQQRTSAVAAAAAGVSSAAGSTLQHRDVGRGVGGVLPRRRQNGQVGETAAARSRPAVGRATVSARCCVCRVRGWAGRRRTAFGGPLKVKALAVLGLRRRSRRRCALLALLPTPPALAPAPLPRRRRLQSGCTTRAAGKRRVRRRRRRRKRDRKHAAAAAGTATVATARARSPEEHSRPRAGARRVRLVLQAARRGVQPVPDRGAACVAVQTLVVHAHGVRPERCAGLRADGA
eukprot:Rhum_TRINITY_DN14788_c26_g1::Rhum_TRINITY_DN14788_c26_g1_i1::g.119238::m.119238